MARLGRYRFRKMPGPGGGGSGPAIVWKLSFTDAQGFTADDDEVSWMASPGFGNDAAFGATSDGLRGFADNTPLYGHANGDLIESGHSKVDGTTGRIFRHVRSYDPTQPTGYANGGGFAINFTHAAFGGPFREFWFRWYQRWQTGFIPTATDNTAGTGNWIQTKCFYFNVSSGAGFPGWFTVGYGQSQQWGIQIIGNAGGPARDCHGSPGWQTQMGGNYGDGTWHRFEVHVKADTGTTDGVCEAWHEDSTNFTATNVDWSGGDGGWVGWQDVAVGSNAAYAGSDVTNAADMLVDYDMFAMSTVGRIGAYSAGRGY